MLFGKYQFLCRFDKEAILPHYKGSTFRGVFGHALRQVVCPVTNQECPSCQRKHNCVYALVFETASVISLPEKSVVHTPSPPFVIEPPLNTKTRFSKGNAFDFNLLLFGQINRNFPYFIHTFEEMGKIGVGKFVDGERGIFSVRSVKYGDEIIYSDTDKSLKSIELGNIGLESPENCSSEDNLRLSIIIETPVRVKTDNRLSNDLPFDVFIRTCLRRISSLFSCYGDGNPQLDYKGLAERAKSVRIADKKLHWFDWRRYSNRQEDEMQLGGLMGSITYEGKLGEFLPYIRFCTEAHIGKQTSFGLGKFRAEIRN